MCPHFQLIIHRAQETNWLQVHENLVNKMEFYQALQHCLYNWAPSSPTPSQTSSAKITTSL